MTTAHMAQTGAYAPCRDVRAGSSEVTRANSCYLSRGQGNFRHRIDAAPLHLMCSNL